MKRLQKQASTLDKLKLEETMDYQNRGGNYPKAGKPDTIEVVGNEGDKIAKVYGSFKNTSERDATKWMERHFSDYKIVNSGASQTGDYDDDWVEAYVEIEL